ncbi:unnamed protein product [Gadus morhua 'NCC']
MPLYSDISGTETGKCTDCTKLRQTVALMETRLAALEKCKGPLQDTVPMDGTDRDGTTSRHGGGLRMCLPPSNKGPSQRKQMNQTL